mmetsp:Transcript_4413/g.9566  ORF Transcript_4413/g.9566 Transcript_4413/m.9566 type:complete len:299 (-) Transcript_4413:352-1248(-)
MKPASVVVESATKRGERRGRRSRSGTSSSSSSLLLMLLVLIVAASSLFSGTESFRAPELHAPCSSRSKARNRCRYRDDGASNACADASPFVLKAAAAGPNDNNNNNNDDDDDGAITSQSIATSRRTILSRVASLSVLAATSSSATTATLLIGNPREASAAANTETDVSEMRALISEALSQLDTATAMIREEKWDRVRGLLTEAPLRDCWSKTTPILKKYADALGDTGGDELAALEGREDLLQHLRFLDMAVYNNVFNPIATEGKTGASKALIDSYYNDPTREYEASKRAFEELLNLSK